MWLKRLMDRFRRADEPSAQEQNVQRVLFNRGVYETASEFLAALLTELQPPLDENSLAHIARDLLPNDVRVPDLDQHIEFWSVMASRFDGNAYVIACYADTLHMADRTAAVSPFLDAFEIDPTLIHEFDIRDEARALGGMVWLRYQLAELLADIAADDPDVDPRETYSELLEQHDGNEAALDAIREVGIQISHLEAEDQLPRALVRRGSWRKKSS
jgi:hypothetical protein